MEFKANATLSHRRMRSGPNLEWIVIHQPSQRVAFGGIELVSVVRWSGRETIEGLVAIVR